MSEFEIDCVVRRDGSSSHEAITHVGGPSGGRWLRTAQQIVQLIESRSDVFFVNLPGGGRALVGVVNGPNGKYLRTYADGKWSDNLIHLRQCAGG